MEGYPLCRIEAFVESISHLQNISDRREIINSFVSAQASGKYVKEYVRGIRVKKGGKTQEGDADDLWSAFRAGFKGLE